ncbi:hypothetical protein M885DRAFT_539777 [Pelagophyceae sp. CCMP2097]|nr:hypothetical protein M885DRAFT_539777 [Pelagophyceae sp. CCMP2097]|mmetsp:Transcript_14293/g.47761  ORF Transcript_14293/g.47761 Transcript_14293/m.47761 type:complete len:249 (-) Transcript_14293:1415-2161(-)
MASRSLAVACALATCAGFVATPRLSARRAPALFAEADAAEAQGVDVFVGNLKFGTTDADLVEIATARSSTPIEIIKVTIPFDAATGFERGFGFIKVANWDQATIVADELNNFELFGRILNSHISSKERAPRPAFDPNQIDDGGILGRLGTYASVLDVQEEPFDFLRAACKKAGVKAGGNLDQLSARLFAMQGLTPKQWLEPARGLISTRDGARNDSFRHGRFGAKPPRPASAPAGGRGAPAKAGAEKR